MKPRLGRYAVLACVIFMPLTLAWVTAEAHDRYETAAKDKAVEASGLFNALSECQDTIEILAKCCGPEGL